MLELAALEDREAVNRLARQVHALHVAWRPDIYESADVLYPEDLFLQGIRNREIFVAKWKGCVLGYAKLKMCEYRLPGHAYRKVMLLDEICVEDSVRNQGIGTQMMKDIHALAAAFGCTDIQLGVYPQNDAAVTFYQKCGFTIRSIDMQKKV